MKRSAYRFERPWMGTPSFAKRVGWIALLAAVVPIVAILVLRIDVRTVVPDFFIFLWFMLTFGSLWAAWFVKRDAIEIDEFRRALTVTRSNLIGLVETRVVQFSEIAGAEIIHRESNDDEDSPLPHPIVRLRSGEIVPLLREKQGRAKGAFGRREAEHAQSVVQAVTTALSRSDRFGRAD